MATSTSEATPNTTVSQLNCSSTSKPTSAWATMNSVAFITLTCPEGIGRERVRSTLSSMSRSTMSLKVQPAPRITTAPAKHSSSAHQSKPAAGFLTAASASEKPQGQNSSQKPIGRSQRASRA